jgi:hypothetical protein
MYWTDSSGRIELKLTMREAQSASHQGQCDSDVLTLSQRPTIARQLAKIDPAQLRRTLSEYGAWDDAELADHAQNLQRMLWIAAGDIAEGNC